MPVASTVAATAPAVGGVIGEGIDLVGDIGGFIGIGGGDGPDPKGTHRHGTPPFGAVVYEDRTDQNGNDPARALIGEGQHQLDALAGWARAASVESGWTLTLVDNRGQTHQLRGPTNGKVNFRDRGIPEEAVTGVSLQRTRQAPSPDPGAGGGNVQVPEPRAAGLAGNQSLMILLLGAALLFIANQ